jgi:hypothetical protein
MSGPPHSEYTYRSELQPDDVTGCRCLYGLRAGQSASYLCGDTGDLDFDVVPIGEHSAAQTLTITSGGDAPVTLGTTFVYGTQYEITDNICAPGRTLAHGEACTMRVASVSTYEGFHPDQLRIESSTQPLLVTLLAYAPAVPNYQGLWWTPGENGWGVSLAHADDRICLTWYTFGDAGSPTWLAMLASRTASGTYEGVILEVHGPPFDRVPFVPAPTPTVVGSGSLTFTGMNDATFAYSAKNVIATKNLTRFAIADPSPVCTYRQAPDYAAATNYQGLWWNAAENGWGLNIAHSQHKIYVTWYTFDASGAPMWMSAYMTGTGNSFNGAMLRVSGPPFGPSFDPGLVHIDIVGTASLSFANGDAATWAYTVSGASGVKPISRYRFTANAGTLCE